MKIRDKISSTPKTRIIALSSALPRHRYVDQYLQTQQQKQQKKKKKKGEEGMLHRE